MHFKQVNRTTWMWKVNLYLSKPMKSQWRRFALSVKPQKPFTTSTQTLKPHWTHLIMRLTLFLLAQQYCVSFGSGVWLQFLWFGKKSGPCRRRMLRSSLLWWAVCAWLCQCPSLYDSMESGWSLGDAASFSFPVAELMRFPSPLFRKKVLFGF